VRIYHYEGGEAEYVMSLEAFGDGFTHGATVAAGRF
jgi:hypothetical protein